jgi:hypothetical protein
VRRSKPVIISDLLRLFIREHNLENGFRQYRFLKLWDEILGPTVAQATVSKQLSGKKLYVSLSSSVVRAELYMHRSEIISKLNSRMGEIVIDEIILK